jgi:hypothetical protein
MDPISVIGLVISLGQVVGQLKDMFEVVKDAPEAFAVVVFQADRFRRELDRLSSLEHRLRKDEIDYLHEQVNPKECGSIVDELGQLVKKVSPNWESKFDKSKEERALEKMTLKERITWLWNRDEVKKLADKLGQRADRVRDSMKVIGLYVKLQILYNLKPFRLTAMVAGMKFPYKRTRRK